MNRLILGFTLVMGIGCTGIQPIGPLAKKGGGPASDSKADKNALLPEPVTIPAPKPTPPLKLVDPDEVNADNANQKVKQVEAEIQADRKSMPAPPVTAEVSHYKGGVKQDN